MSTMLNQQASDLLAGAVEQVATAGVTALSDEIERRVEQEKDDQKSILRTFVVGSLVLIGTGVVVSWAIDKVQEKSATDDETSAPMAADDVVSGEFDEYMVALNLQQSPSQVWSGIGQLVADQLSDSVIPPAATARIPKMTAHRAAPVDIAGLRPGDVILHSDDGSDVRVNAIDPGRVLAVERSDGSTSWSVRLEATEEGGTRLVSRRRVASGGTGDRARNMLLRPARGISDLLSLLELDAATRPVGNEPSPNG